MSFTSDINSFVNKASKNAEKVFRATSIMLFTKIVLRTPVGNPDLWVTTAVPSGYVGGRLRGNWFIGFGNPDRSTTEAPDKSGGSTLINGTQQINKASPKQDLFITNSLPYIRDIEYGSRSLQAPHGMVRITAAEFKSVVSRSAKKFKNR